jgi:hypothetical protein
MAHRSLDNLFRLVRKSLDKVPIPSCTGRKDKSDSGLTILYQNIESSSDPGRAFFVPAISVHSFFMENSNGNHHFNNGATCILFHKTIEIGINYLWKHTNS